MEAGKLKARVRDAHLEWVDTLPALPDGDVEVILLYQQQEKRAAIPATEWPSLKGGKYLGGSLRREDIYGDDGR